MGMTVALLNLKGGVGKSSITYHVGGMLAKSGRRVLVGDFDPQASLTQGFWGPQATRDLPAWQSVAALFDPDQSPIPESLVRPTGVPGLDLLPGSRHLGRANMTPPEDWGFHQDAAKEALAELEDSYDVILLDCPPNLYLCSWSAMVAATAVAVPLQAEDFGSQGLAPVQEAVAAVQAGPNPRLRLAGYVLSMFDKRLTVHLTYEAMLRELYAEAVFANAIPRAKDFVEAVAARQPISVYKPKCASAKAAAAVGEELMERVAGASEARRVA